MTVYGVHVPVVERMIILWGLGMVRYRSAMYGRVWPCGVWRVACGRVIDQKKIPGPRGAGDTVDRVTRSVRMGFLPMFRLHHEPATHRVGYRRGF